MYPNHELDDISNVEGKQCKVTIKEDGFKANANLALRGFDDVDDDDDEVPRTVPPPFPIPPSPSIDRSANRSKSPLFQRVKSPVPLVSVPFHLPHESTKVSGGSGRLLSSESMSWPANRQQSSLTSLPEIEDDSSLLTPREVPVAHKPSVSPLRRLFTANIEDEASNVQGVRDIERVTSSVPASAFTPHSPPKKLSGQDPVSTMNSAVYRSPTGIVEEATASAESTSRVIDARGSKMQPTTAFVNAKYQPLYTADQIPGGHSLHSAPMANSSKLLEIALDKINAKIENDEFSISTIETSSTMRLRAAQRAVNADSRVSLYNYAELTPITDAEAARRAPKKLRVPKQVNLKAFPLTKRWSIV